MEIMEIMEIMETIFYWMYRVAFAGILAYGLLGVWGALCGIVSGVTYQYQKAQIHKGQIFVFELHKHNPFKETDTLHAEVVDYKDGYVCFIADGKELSLPVRDFLDKFRVWYGTHTDYEDA